jgi:glycosyltransferase involved in cell wall biosynthesis
MSAHQGRGIATALRYEPGGGRLLNVHRYHFRKGGAEAVYLDHARLFRSRGWECAELAMAHPSNEESPWQRYFPAHFAPEIGWSGLASVSRFVYSVEAKRNMERILDDFRPDIVHVHGLYQQLTPSVLEPVAARRIPIVYTVHDFKLLCPAYTLYTPKLGHCERCASGATWHSVVHRCLHDSRAASVVYAADALYHRWRNSYAAVSAYVMPSRSILDTHRRYGFPPDRLHHVPNFFETGADQAPSPAAVDEARDRYGDFVFYFGRLSREKGCVHLIEACSVAGLPLVFAGEGPDEGRLLDAAARSNAPVFFTGHRSGRDLWALLEASLAVALPSVWHEIAPKSVLEALARGKPVVASAIGGLPELVEHGVTGFLVPPGDAPALAEALGRVAALSAAERAALAERARRDVHARFSADRYSRAIESIYASLRSNRVSR